MKTIEVKRQVGLTVRDILNAPVGGRGQHGCQNM